MENSWQVKLPKFQYYTIALASYNCFVQALANFFSVYRVSITIYFLNSYPVLYL